MTEEEVELIYNYLHENYKYEDGELIRIKSTPGSNIGDRAGTISLDRGKRIVINVSVGSRKNKRIISLANMIYIFHHKIKAKYINYIDGNYANTNIENLEEISKSKQLLIVLDGRGYTPLKDKNGKTRYHCQINIQEETISLGVFNNKKDARNLYLKAKNLYLNGASILEIKKKLISGKNDKNITGLKGVRFVKGKYYGVFQVNKVRGYTKAFSTPEEAHAAYLKAKEEYARTKTLPE
jgi:hypothetical protein